MPMPDKAVHTFTTDRRFSPDDLPKIQKLIDQYHHLIDASRSGFYSLYSHVGGEREFPVKDLPSHVHGAISEALASSAADIQDKLRDEYNFVIE